MKYCVLTRKVTFIEVGASEILYIDKESDFIEVGASLNFDMDK